MKTVCQKCRAVLKQDDIGRGISHGTCVECVQYIMEPPFVLAWAAIPRRSHDVAQRVVIYLDDVEPFEGHSSS